MIISNATTNDQMANVKKAILEFSEKRTYRFFRVSADGIDNSECQIILSPRQDTIVQKRACGPHLFMFNYILICEDLTVNNTVNECNKKSVVMVVDFYLFIKSNIGLTVGIVLFLIAFLFLITLVILLCCYGPECIKVSVLNNQFLKI